MVPVLNQQKSSNKATVLRGNILKVLSRLETFGGCCCKVQLLDRDLDNFSKEECLLKAVCTEKAKGDRSSQAKQ